MILCLQEVELLLDPVAGLGNRELELLVWLRRALQIKEKNVRNFTSMVFLVPTI